MRVVRINKGKYLHLSLRLLGVGIIAFSVIQTFREVEEPWSIFISALISLLLPIIWFSNKIIMIDLRNNSLFDGVWIMGFKVGETVKFESIEDFTVKKVKTGKTVYSLPNNQNIVTDHEFQAYVQLNDGREFYLLSHPLKERIEEKLTQIKQKLELVL